MAKNIDKLPTLDRPYEKLETFGSENLTISELLAIILRSGTKNKSSVQLAMEILNTNSSKYQNDIEYLTSLSLSNLKQFKGIGRVKAIQISAVMELAKRINSNISRKKSKVVCPNDAYKIVCSMYFGMKTEMVSIIILDNACNVIEIEKISSGLVNNVSLGVKEVFSGPIKNMATSIILVHNHPSGNMQPSKQDIIFTRKMAEYGATFNIKVSDHIIIGKNEYISMKEKGLF